jgi:hypothetical protein
VNRAWRHDTSALMSPDISADEPSRARVAAETTGLL